jgi:hypothetical protein
LGNGDGTFRAAVNYDVGSLPSSAAVGDFNGDGKLDVAVTNAGNNNVSVLLGNGDGTLQAAANYGTGSEPSFVAVGDFNGDGKLDLAVTNATSNNVSVLLGNGDGTFRAAVNYSTGLGPDSVVAGDFNGDGRLDLAVANGGSNSVGVLLGNGDGSFQTAVAYSTVAAFAIAIGDFTGSGILDLAVPGSILVGKGDGTFQVLSGPNFVNSPSLLAADFNGDGTTDLAGMNVPGDGLTPSVAVFLNKPVIALYPNQLTFPAQPVGVTSAPQTVTVTNLGIKTLQISSIVAKGDFAETSNCNSTLTDGTQCSITATFTPKAVGASTGSLTITDNALGSPHVIGLTGSSGAAVSLSSTSLTFAGQEVSTTGARQAVTLTNTGSEPLIITSLTASGDFAETNTCGSSVAIGVNCTISVTFTPTAGGPRTGAITINDNALGSPQQVTLSGVGQDFAIGFSRTTQSVIAGQTASYELLISPLGGFNQAVALSCSGAPQFANCVVSPASIAPANGPVWVSVKVTTRASSQTSGPGAAPRRRPPFPPAGGPWLWLEALSTGLLAVAARKRRLVLASALMLLSVTMWVACGGGAAPSIFTPGTPNGTFTVVVNAMSGPLSHSATTTLVVSGSAGPT